MLIIMSSITLSINDIKISISLEVLEKIPYFDGPARECHVLVTDININRAHILAIIKCIQRELLVPTVDLVSQKDVLTTLKLAKFLKISDDEVSAGFNGWTQHIKWVDLWHPEYMYSVYIINDDLVNFYKFFHCHDDAFRRILSPEVAYDTPEIYINMLLFFRNFNVATCFENNDDTVHKKIEYHNKVRLSLWKTFLVNPHLYATYFEHKSSHEQVWDCTRVSCVKPYNTGDRAIVDFGAACIRLREFTYGLLEKPLNDGAHTFPFEDVVIAGGSITKILSPNYDINSAHQSDVDIFIFADSAKKRMDVFENIINWFKSYDADTKISNTYFAMRGCVVTIYIKNIRRKFQVICINCATPYDILARFDFTHIAWCYWNGAFYGLPDACNAMRTSVTSVMNIARIKIERIIKALYCGFSIAVNKEIYDITDLLNDPDLAQIKKYIRELYGWFYPISCAELTHYEEQQHILCMINKDTSADVITDDARVVIDNVVIGGNFNSDYVSNMYSTF